MPQLHELLIYALLLLFVVMILALAGATISIRHGQTQGRVSMRSIIRAALGHRERDRHNQEPPQ